MQYNEWLCASFEEILRSKAEQGVLAYEGRSISFVCENDCIRTWLYGEVCTAFNYG